MLAPGRCQFCLESFPEVGQIVAGGDGLICDACVRASARLLDAGKDGEGTDPPDRHVYRHLERHFAPRSPHEVLSTSRAFPLRQQADLQRALDELLGERRVPENFLGFMAPFARDGIGYAKLLEVRLPAEIAPPQYMEVELGRGETVRCLKNGLWLLRDGAEPYAVVLSYTDQFTLDQHLQLEVAVLQGERGIALSARLFHEIERRLTGESCYRGRVLSLEQGNSRSGHAQRIMVHDLPPVERDALILPEDTLCAIERNVLKFSRQRSALRALGLSTQKGLLFHGPPGVGKTHCIRYLAGRLEGHTTLLITAEQVALLPEYMALARLLQPALVVIEDADLIASARGAQAEGVLLNRLLNELDGLREQADVLFVLTTNNPEALEPALVSRPGRIDQAIEFPLPDASLRQRLIRLYARSLAVPEELIGDLALRTEGASPAFIKELMRRIAQHHLERGDGADVTRATMESALHEMLFSGGILNRRLLGAAGIGFTRIS
jgi:hypothetical protein